MAKATKLLWIAIVLVAALAAVGSASASVKGGLAESHVERVALAMDTSTAMHQRIVLDLDAELDNPSVATDDALTPARGCKGCFG